MKRPILSFLAAALLLVSLLPQAYANSGPVFWPGYPASDLLSVEENSPIEVAAENLVFDFTAAKDTLHTISGEVSACYEMVNPTNQALTVPMAFPCVGTLSELSPDDILITADQEELPYQLYIGDIVNSRSNSFPHDAEAELDFTGIISNITVQPYQAQNFTANEKGRLYRLVVKPTTDQRVNVAVAFNFDYQKTKILANGFNRYERDGKKTRIAAWCYQEETLEILVLGEDVALQVNAYSDGELKEETTLATHRTTVSEVGVRQYLEEYLKRDESIKDKTMVSSTQLYNLYAKALDHHFTQQLGFCTAEDLKAQSFSRRVLTLVYSVDFLPHSKKEVSVRYQITGTMDMQKTAMPLYSFTYLLNPAQRWGSFKNLNLTIITPEEAPYIVQSSIALVKEKTGVYTAALPELPESDLSFTLFYKESIALTDRIGRMLRNSLGYLYPLLVMAIGLLSVGALLVLIATVKKAVKRRHVR